MSSKKNPKSADKLAAKKAAVLGNQKRKRTPLLVGAAVIVLAAAGALYATGGMKSQPFEAAQQTPEPDAIHYAYPVSLFDDGVARHFEHVNEGMTIRYFVLKSSDGVIRAAFDACDVCWPAGKGYYQDGDVMVCRNCGRRFDSVRVNEVKGGCNPAPLTRTVAGNDVVIRIEDILQGQKYFNFGGGGRS